MVKNKNNEFVDENAKLGNDAAVTPTVAPEVTPSTADSNETVNIQAADPNVDNEATTTPDVSEVTAQPKSETKKTSTKKQNEEEDFEKLVSDTIRGVYGSGRERMYALGSNYAKVQMEVNKRTRANRR